VVQDMFLSETAKLADVILPAASFAEKEGTFINFEGRINRLQQAIKPIAESLPDWQIILRLADAMECPLPFSSLQQVMDEIKKLVPLYESVAESQPPTEFTFSPVEYTPQVEETKEDYPFTLLTGTVLHHFGTGTRSSRAWRLKKISPQAFVEIGESDAQKLGLSHGDKVKVISPVAELTSSQNHQHTP